MSLRRQVSTSDFWFVRRHAIKTLVALILIVAAIVTFVALVPDSPVESVCDDATEGTPIEQVRMAAIEEGLRAEYVRADVRPYPRRLAISSSSKLNLGKGEFSYGSVCIVTYDPDGGVLHSTYTGAP